MLPIPQDSSTLMPHFFCFRGNKERVVSDNLNCNADAQVHERTLAFPSDFGVDGNREAILEAKRLHQLQIQEKIHFTLFIYEVI